MARFGLTVREVADTVETALGGRPAGMFFSGDRRFQIVVRVPNALRSDAEALGAIPVMLPQVEGHPRVSGVAVLNGLVLIASIHQRLEQGLERIDAIVQGSIERLRAVLLY